MKRKSRKKVLAFSVIFALIIGITGVVIWRVRSGSISNNTDAFILLSDGFTDRIVTDRVSALAAIGDVADELGIQDVNAEFSSYKEDTVSGNTYYRFYQEYEGIPVYGRSLVVAADENGSSLSLSGNYLIADRLDTSPAISEADAIKSAGQYYGSNAEIISDGMAIYSLNGHQPELAWKFYVNFNNTTEYCFISAVSGDVLAQNSLVYTESILGRGMDIDESPVEFNAIRLGSMYSLEDEYRNIHVYNANEETLLNRFSLANNIYSCNLSIHPENSREISLVPVANVDSVWEDSKAVTSITRAAAIYDFYKEVLKRNGFNGNGGELNIVYNDYKGGDVTNAYSSGGNTQQTTVLSFAINNSMSYDTFGHEFTHSVEQSISNMVYLGESGALMEAYSDIFGEIFEDWQKGKTLNADCDWVHSDSRNLENPLSIEHQVCYYEYIGEVCPLKEKGGSHVQNGFFTVSEGLLAACQVMRPANPNYYQGEAWKDTTPQYDLHTGETTNDYGGVHINNTVISHAAYLMYNGISGNNPNFEALTTEELAHLFYETLFTLPSDCSFSQFRTLLQNMAEIMYHQGRLSYQQSRCVSNAFFHVGIDPSIMPVSKDGLCVDVYGIDGQLYEDYTLYVRHNSGAEKTYSYDDIADDGIHFPTTGSYELCIVDNANTSNQTSITVMVVEQGGVTEAPVFTQCGLAMSNATIEIESEQSSGKDIPVSLLSHDPFSDHKMQFELTEYDVSGGIRETDGNYNTYMDLPDFPVIASLTDDFGHNGNMLQLIIGKGEYRGDKYLAIDFNSENGKRCHYLLRPGDWAGESVYCYISHGVNTDYLVMEKVSPTSSAVGSDTFYIGRANGCFQEEIRVIALNDFSEVKYTLNYDREYKELTIREEASDLEWGRYLCRQNGTNLIYVDDNDSLYDSYDEAMEHIKSRLSKYGSENRIGLDETGDSQSTNVIPLFLVHQNGIQQDVSLTSISDVTLRDVMILGVNSELSPEGSEIEPENPTSPSNSGSLLGTWDSNDGEMRLIFNSTGSDMAFTKGGIKNASGSITIIDLKKGEKSLGAYIIDSNAITVVLDLNEHEMNYSFDNSTLIVGEKEFHRMDSALINQLIGTWEGDGLKIYFGKDNDVTLYEKSRTRHGLYAVLSESEVLINVDGYAVNASNYSVNGTMLNFNGAMLYKDGADTSYTTISSFADKVIGDWKACNDETGSYYVFTEGGNYEYYSMEGIFHPTLSGRYEIISENELHLVYDQYSYSVLTLESDDILKDSGGREYVKVK